MKDEKEYYRIKKPGRGRPMYQWLTLIELAYCKKRKPQCIFTKLPVCAPPNNSLKCSTCGLSISAKKSLLECENCASWGNCILLAKKRLADKSKPVITYDDILDVMLALDNDRSMRL